MGWLSTSTEAEGRLFLRATGLVAALVVLGGCSFIEFESGPYVVRDLEVVYSEQEQTTFFVWRLRDDAVLERVDFELYRDGDYEPIDLQQTRFPAEPYGCGDGRICFQYQVSGEYELPDGPSPIRSRHASEGTFAGPEVTKRRVEETFDIEPVAVERNEAVAPRRFDWFAEEDVPLRRGFEWRFVPADGDECGQGDGSWQGLSAPTGVDYAWVERSVCFAVRPEAARGEVVRVAEPLSPSAETYAERQTYTPDRIDAPIAYGIVLDLSVPNEQRCEQVQQTLLDRLRSAVEGRGESQELGVYRPRSGSDGEPLDGCNQQPGRQLPLAEMSTDASRVAAELSPPEVRVLWIYANNINLEPRDQIRDQLDRWKGGFGEGSDVALFNWAIAANAILATGGWDYTTGWRPVEDETLAGDIRSFADNYLPFATMDHEAETEVAIEPVEGADDPEAFKVCRASPFPVAEIGVRSGEGGYDAESPHVPWPEQGEPYYRVEIPPQHLVPRSQYVVREVELVVEVCERFCDHRFRSEDGEIYENWKQTPGSRPLEVCRWSD